MNIWSEEDGNPEIQAVRSALDVIEKYADVEESGNSLEYVFGQSRIVVEASPDNIVISLSDYSDEYEGSTPIVQCSPREFVEYLDVIVAKLMECIDGINRGMTGILEELGNAE
jgi:hypothetical protein